jgi:hypothetical protein
MDAKYYRLYSRKEVLLYCVQGEMKRKKATQQFKTAIPRQDIEIKGTERKSGPPSNFSNMHWVGECGRKLPKNRNIPEKEEEWKEKGEAEGMIWLMWRNVNSIQHS